MIDKYFVWYSNCKKKAGRPQCYTRTDSNIQTTHVRLIKKTTLWVNKWVAWLHFSCVIPSPVLLLTFTSTFIFISRSLALDSLLPFFQFRIILFAGNIICCKIWLATNSERWERKTCFVEKSMRSMLSMKPHNHSHWRISFLIGNECIA